MKRPTENRVNHPQMHLWMLSIFHECTKTFKAPKLAGINQSESTEFWGDSAVSPWILPLASSHCGELPEDTQKTLTVTSIRTRDWAGGTPWQVRPKKPISLKTWRSYMVSNGNLPKRICARLCLFNGYKYTDHYTSVKHFLWWHLTTFHSRKRELEKESGQERERARHLKYLFSKSLSLTSSHSHSVISYISLYTHKTQFNTQICLHFVTCANPPHRLF